MYCYYELIALFKSYKASTASGDAIAMEYIKIEFYGIFILLRKHKSTEIFKS